jgi:four helix bundle protein
VQRARSKAEFVAKLGIVVEEADETQFWLELLQEFGVIQNDLLKSLQREIGELVAMFTASLKTASLDFVLPFSPLPFCRYFPRAHS